MRIESTLYRKPNNFYPVRNQHAILIQAPKYTITIRYWRFHSKITFWRQRKPWFQDYHLAGIPMQRQSDETTKFPRGPWQRSWRQMRTGRDWEIDNFVGTWANLVTTQQVGSLCFLSAAQISIMNERQPHMRLLTLESPVGDILFINLVTSHSMLMRSTFLTWYCLCAVKDIWKVLSVTIQLRETFNKIVITFD